ncbi:hypothetical protein V6N11_050655 [Hibiscus sabdariffa]|uniref:WRKY domain-containing protein n=2 Tax=Hibiscus sabdariffa TaxID=183260 RepID=A0ABR2TBF4_9ROSI
MNSTSSSSSCLTDTHSYTALTQTWAPVEAPSVTPASFVPSLQQSLTQDFTKPNLFSSNSRSTELEFTEESFSMLSNSSFMPFATTEESIGSNSKKGSSLSAGKQCTGRRRINRVKKVIRVPAISSMIGDVPADEYSWRKGYYKCSSFRGCPARKHVERAMNEGEHHHSQPAVQKNMSPGEGFFTREHEERASAKSQTILQVSFPVFFFSLLSYVNAWILLNHPVNFFSIMLHISAKRPQPVPKASGSRFTELRKEVWAAKEIRLTDDKNNVSELPKCPNCSSLIVLYLQGNYELTAIPPLFFQRMALLQVLDLSRTSIKSLPKSLPKLVALKKLLLQSCDLFMELSPQVEKLKNLEELDLDETQIINLPRETGKLLKLRQLKVSFYHLSGKKKLMSNILIHPETISNLSQLAELSIDVNPADNRWDDSVEAVVKEVCNSKTLTALTLYLPEFQLLDSTSLIYPSLSRFRFTVGRHKRRIISRVPNEVEAEFRNWDKCLKFVNGENIPIEIKGVLKYSTSFFLDHHATAVTLSEFGIENMNGLKFLLLAECNEMETLTDGDMHYERNGDVQSEPDPGSVEPVLESLEYLSIYYMESLHSIWRGPNRFGCMSKLKFLALHTCPQLSKIFSHALLENFINLEEIILEDCPQVTSLVSHSSVKPMMSNKIFLPSLKRLLLLYLPELASISNGLLIAPKLESIGCYNCPNLTSISKMELSSKTLKIIKGEYKWWEDMNWNETEWGNRPDYLMHIFFPIDNEKDVMTQLVDDGHLLEAIIQNEGQQLGNGRLIEVSTQDHKNQCKEEKIKGTDVIESPSACLLPSNPLSRTSHAPEQGGSYTSDKNKSLEDDYCDVASKVFEADADEDEPKAKRWNHTENENNGIIGLASKPVRGNRAENQIRSKEVDDGYKWRKYGQKWVKGNSYLRSYYKCLSMGCPMRKHVERDSQDTGFFVTTYNGIHNHHWRYVRGLYKLHSQPCSDHWVNNVEDAAEASKTVSPTRGYEDVFEASILDQEAHTDGTAKRTRTDIINIIPSTLPTMPRLGPGLTRPAKLQDHPVLRDNSNVLPSPTTGDCAVQSLNQKGNSGDDQQTISREDNNSTIVCSVPPSSPSNSWSMIPQLSATTLPNVRLQTQIFEQLADQNQMYEKHHPPMLEDEVWRLEKIGKDGVFHKNLASFGVNTVQDFLKMLIVYPGNLRNILGARMSEEMWNVTIKHAKTCVMGNKHYVFQGSSYRILLNPICQLIKAEINGSIYPTHKLSDVDRAYLENLVRQAYVNWSSLEEMEGTSNEIGLLTQGDHVVDQNPHHQHTVVWPSTATGGCVVSSLNQKSNPGNDQQTVSEEDNNSAKVYHPPPPLPCSSVRVQAHRFEELAEQNKSKGNLQSQASCYKQDRSFQVTRSLEWPTTEVIHRASHNHPKSQPTRTSSQSAFSRILRASNHLNIKIPDKSIVTYEGGQMDDDGLVLFMRRETAMDVDVRKAKKSFRKPAKTTVYKFSAGTNFREMVQRLTGMRNEALEEVRIKGIPRKKEWDANLKEISGSDIHRVRQNVDGLCEADGIESIESHTG